MSRSVDALTRNHPLLRRLSEEEYGKIQTYGAVLNQTQLAALLRIPKDTFNDILSRDARARETMDAARAETIGVVGEGLIQKALKGDTASQIFFLKTQAGWRETARLEVVEPTNEAVQKLAGLLGMDVEDAEVVDFNQIEAPYPDEPVRDDPIPKRKYLKQDKERARKKGSKK